ncbi:MAG TPA: PhoU domain-containing protein [Patescibacteria group bacterium]|nr:PhoU domain-containing protein [Patescibacteria group bacterium]
MPALNDIISQIGQMSQLCLKMWQTTFRAFMEHDRDLVSAVLEDEKRLNEFEKELTAALVESGKSSGDKAQKAQALKYADVVADLEIIGDYCKDILERVEIKIEEKLMFSDEAVKEYEGLYQRTEAALREVSEALVRAQPCFVQIVLKDQEHIDKLVDEYRQHHNQRLIDGVCSPIACNMFLNILDFTAAVYYHAKKIARTLLKIKK